MALPADSASATPSPHFPGAWKKGKPQVQPASLCAPGLLSLPGTGAQAGTVFNSQAGLREPAYKERKGEFLSGLKVGITSSCPRDCFLPS